MQLLILVLNKVEVLEKLLEELSNSGIKGATIINSTGMARALGCHYEDVPFLGSLRLMLDPDREENKTIFTLIKDEQLQSALTVIRNVVGDLNKPDTAIVFTLPVSYAEGVGF